MDGEAADQNSNKGSDGAPPTQKQSRRTRARGGGGVRQKQKKNQKKDGKKLAGETVPGVLGGGQHDMANMATQMMLLHVGGQPVSVVPIMQMGVGAAPPPAVATPPSDKPKNDGLNTKAKPFQPQGFAERQEQIAWSTSAQAAAHTQSKKELENAVADAVKAKERQKEKAASKEGTKPIETPPPPISPDSEPTTPTIAASVLQQLDLYDQDIVVKSPTSSVSADDVVLDFPWKDEFTLPSQATDVTPDPLENDLEELEQLHLDSTPATESLPQPKKQKKKKKKTKDQDQSKDDEIIEVGLDKVPEMTPEMMQPFMMGGMMPPMMVQPMLLNNGVMMPQPMMFPGAGMMPVGVGMGAMGVPLLPMAAFPGMTPDMAAQLAAATEDGKEGMLPKHVMDFFPGNGTPPGMPPVNLGPGIDPPAQPSPPESLPNDNNVMDFFKAANIVQENYSSDNETSDSQSPHSVPEHTHPLIVPQQDPSSTGLEAFMNANSIGTG